MLKWEIQNFQIKSSVARAPLTHFPSIICSSQRLKCFYCYSSNFFGEGNGTPLQYSCLENPMDGGAWKAEVHGVAEGRTRLSHFTFTFHFHTLEKEMATHSSVLAWRIPGMGDPGGLPSLGLHRVRHDWSDLAAAVIFFYYFQQILKFYIFIFHLKIRRNKW